MTAVTATVRVGASITSVTTATTGQQVPTADSYAGAGNTATIVVTPLEANTMCVQQAQPIVGATTNMTTGTVNIHMRGTVITSLTVNAHVYAVTAGVAANVLPADAQILIQSGFKFVSN